MCSWSLWWLNSWTSAEFWKGGLVLAFVVWLHCLAVVCNASRLWLLVSVCPCLHNPVHGLVVVESNWHRCTQWYVGCNCHQHKWNLHQPIAIQNILTSSNYAVNNSKEYIVGCSTFLDIVPALKICPNRNLKQEAHTAANQYIIHQHRQYSVLALHCWEQLNES